VTRHQRSDALRAEADKLVAGILAEVRALVPMGIASDVSLAMGARPTRGVLVSTPLATYVFAKARVPSQDQLDAWEQAYRRAEDLRRQALDLSSWSVIEKGRTIGNRLPLEQGERLAAAGLLGRFELAHLAALRAFWDAHPDASTGVVRAGGAIEPI
jgi:hypothetical protein